MSQDSRPSINRTQKQWQDFLVSLAKRKPNPPKFYELIIDSYVQVTPDQVTVFLQVDERVKQATSQHQKIQNDSEFPFPRKRLYFELHDPNQLQVKSPLERLKHFQVGDFIKPALDATVQEEQACQKLYDVLNERTRHLATHQLEVPFAWRVRVGGQRGFLDLLLPVMHKVYGVPYVPASSLKGSVRAWARQNKQPQIAEWLGCLDEGIGKVEFLDSFPTSPCLDVDVATPQWHWQGTSDRTVQFKPEPHPLLSLKNPTLLIGLRPSSRGKIQDVEQVLQWVESALNCGIGSRVSSGYGRRQAQATEPSETLRTFKFKLWTQGTYGVSPPTKTDKTGTPEFRPTAIRGVLRYWFRAVALGIYSPQDCEIWENELFGTLGQQGLLNISASIHCDRNSTPFLYSGTINLESKDREALDLVEQVLKLATCLGGVGRGSRRPLHIVNGWTRGCHWELDSSDLPLPYDAPAWNKLIKDARDKCRAWKSSNQKFNCSPGEPGGRQQDVLDDNAQIWLVRSSEIPHPQALISNWTNKGSSKECRGTALNLLYSSDRFKGKSNQNPGNPYVGGAMPGGGLGTPSFVWLKSVCALGAVSYQVVTVFGTDHLDRQAFVQALEDLRSEDEEQAKLAWSRAVENTPVQ